jgi:DNA repair exonuclease SbcCD nuclease subunit
LKIRYKIIISAFIVSALIGCFFSSAAEAAEVKSAKIAVFSDPHYYAPELGTTGSAFEAYLAQDRKLLAESSAISAAAINELKKSDAKIVLISGDLTKDGEKLSHQQFSKLLTSLENSGKKVYVVPGNHDINNPASSSYKGNKATFTDNISPEQFKNIYNSFGFSEAISRDKDSLSYVVEPVPG